MQTCSKNRRQPSPSQTAPTRDIRAIHRTSAALVLGLSLLARTAAPASTTSTASSLQSGKATLTLQPSPSAAPSLTLAYERTDGSIVTYHTPHPLALQLLNQDGSTQWLHATYTNLVRHNASLHGDGHIRSAAGTTFCFTDVYQPGPVDGSFQLNRNVTLRDPSPQDAGFLTRFGLPTTAPLPLRDHEFFIPGICYRQNHYVPPHALAADLTEDAFLIREDRMPLPLVMMRNPVTHDTLTLIHLDPNGATCLADYSSDRVTDSRLQFASLGAYGQEQPAVALFYPGSEGERTYLGRRRRQAPQKRWAERFHPIQTTLTHRYQLLLLANQPPDFPCAMRHAWRAAFDHLHPPVAPIDLQAAYEASIDLIAFWSRTHQGCSGLPFRLRLPEGRLEGNEHINFQMGFVGQQLPLAYHLLRYGLRQNNESLVAKGQAMADFWATRSLTDDGLPRTWFNVYPEPHWRPYPTYLRVVSDGMVGALLAWDIMEHHHRPQPTWLRFCRRFGDWLVDHQNSDGSWYRAYDWNNEPVHDGKQNTSHPIRFLLELALATGDPRYSNAALQAGHYCYPTVHEAFAYVGGTADNPNVIDKEAGFIALDAFLALHDVTGEQRWLNAATQAADFTETWAYCWNIPIPEDDPAVTYPRGATTTGFSIIATGHSGADLFLAGAPFLFYRLYLKTGDVHYAHIARQLLYDTKQGMDINGSLGYGHTGLCTEALSLAPPRGRGVNTWLPWLTYSMIEPIARLQDTYGMLDTPIAVGPQLEALRARDLVFSQSRGLLSRQPAAKSN